MKKFFTKTSEIYQKTLGRLGLIGIIIYMILFMIATELSSPLNLILGLPLTSLAICIVIGREFEFRNKKLNP